MDRTVLVATSSDDLTPRVRATLTDGGAGAPAVTHIRSAQEVGPILHGGGRPLLVIDEALDTEAVRDLARLAGDRTPPLPAVMVVRGEPAFPSGNMQAMIEAGLPHFVWDVDFRHFGDIAERFLSGAERHDRHHRQAQELRHQAERDPLTGLPNRRLLEDRLAQAIKRGRRQGRGFSLLFLDLDAFKGINDAYGHRTGDRVLTETARRLSALVREADTVARYGGDEFVVVLEDTPANSVPGVADKVGETLARPMRIDGREIRCRPSIGRAGFPDDGTTPEALLHHADTAMYRSKPAGTASAPAVSFPRRPTQLVALAVLLAVLLGSAALYWHQVDGVRQADRDLQGLVDFTPAAGGAAAAD